MTAWTVMFGESGPWYIVAVHYPSALQAKRAWERAERKLLGADLDVGVTRLAPPDGGGSIKSGAPEDAHPVVAVTLDENAAARAERVLNDGTAWEPTEDFCLALVARHARVAMQNPAPRQIIIRRDEDRGGRLNRYGEMTEPGA